MNIAAVNTVDKAKINLFIIFLLPYSPVSSKRTIVEPLVYKALKVLVKMQRMTQESTLNDE